eukprot:UN12479
MERIGFVYYFFSLIVTKTINFLRRKTTGITCWFCPTHVVYDSIETFQTVHDELCFEITGDSNYSKFVRRVQRKVSKSMKASTTRVRPRLDCEKENAFNLVKSVIISFSS